MKAIPLVLVSLTGVALAGPLGGRQNQPTKAELCANYGGDDAACKRDFRGCINELQANSNIVQWDGITKCMNLRRPAAPKAQAAEPPVPTKERPATGQASFQADIRADTNRDGVVDIEGSTDVEGKGTWSETLGAIFLANIGDTGRRCSQLPSFQDPSTSYDILVQCHDASDDIQRAPQYMAPIRTVPIAGLSGSATATISVSDPVARLLIRIFRPKGDGWEIVNDDTVFSAEEVSKGLTLGIDARDTRRANGWDGRASVDFTVNDGAATSTDTVMLRLAPVLLHSHRQAIQTVFSSSFPGFDDELKQSIEVIMSGIESSMQKAQVPGPLNRLPTGDAWAQDYFEPGYTSMPGPNGTISLRVMIEGRFDGQDAARLIYTQLRTDGVGALDTTSNKRAKNTFQAGGNMETIPPYEFNGKKYPAGRVIMGADQNNLPLAREFFRAQELQDPLMLDSTWLLVKHIDEMMQFLPSNTPRGWSIMAVDPQLGIRLLKLAQEKGYGTQPVISTNASTLRPTIDEFLATQSNIEAANLTAQRMQANLDIVKKETGISDAEIFRVPALFGPAHLLHPSVQARSINRRGLEGAEEEALRIQPAYLDSVDAYGSDGYSEDNERRQAGSGEKAVSFDSYLPSLVNGIPLSDSHYLAPKPWGPVVNGKDMFEFWADWAYKQAGFKTVDFLDEWLFHSNSGDLHCMTNTFRDASVAWW